MFTRAAPAHVPISPAVTTASEAYGANCSDMEVRAIKLNPEKIGDDAALNNAVTFMRFGSRFS